MGKWGKLLAAAVCMSLTAPQQAAAQGMHFSQYYNAPLLLNPANAALLPEADYRVGVNYRQQWASVPVPYTTYSVFGDMQLMRNRNETNWLGLGAAIWQDQAGAGQLSLSRAEAFVAYHVQMGEFNMISLGASVASVQRKVDFTKLSFDKQWDGFKFDRTKSTGEPMEIRRTNYTDLSVGLNYAFFPNENVYLKVGVGAAHVNQPKETFYNTQNTIGLRPTGNVDLLLRAGKAVIINPSIYYTNQKDASELTYGSTVNLNVAGEGRQASAIIVGAFHRWNEAIVGVIGYQWNSLRVTSSYDYTISRLQPYNSGRGAAEITLIYEGLYRPESGNRKIYNCPRF
jgi:type IX secretion system PorP/SprF family membrane protein